MPEARATLRYSGTAPSKVREVLSLIRGLDVEAARRTLRFTQRAAAEEVTKVLDSAIANAEHNASIPSDELYVSRAYADEGPTLRRFRPRARGRATRIRKRSSHVTIIVTRYSDDELQERRRREATGGTADRRRRLARRRAASRATREAQAVEHEHEHDEAPEGDDQETAPGSAPVEGTVEAEATTGTPTGEGSDAEAEGGEAEADDGGGPTAEAGAGDTAAEAGDGAPGDGADDGTDDDGTDDDGERAE